MPMTGPPPCRTCAYYQPWEGPDATRDGECREQSLPPQVSRSGSQAASDALVTRWAPVHEDEWCGRHPDFEQYLADRNHSAPPAPAVMPTPKPTVMPTVAPAQPAQPAARDRTPNPPAQPQPKPAEPAQPAQPAAKA